MLRLAANLLASAAFVGFGLIAAAALSRIGHRWVDILAQFSAPSLSDVRWRTFEKASIYACTPGAAEPVVEL